MKYILIFFKNSKHGSHWVFAAAVASFEPGIVADAEGADEVQDEED